ncbi:MAG: hypothetical protein LUE13_08770 [Akkermansiaceae bacterium]|nr:hypothetical protein [Akkermansiaceae bacterium]
MANFKITAGIGVFLCLTVLLLTAGCVFRKETALEKFFKQKEFPPYITQKELEKDWERIIENHRKIQKGMDVEQVIAMLGIPDIDSAKHGKTAWVRSEKKRPAVFDLFHLQAG